VRKSSEDISDAADEQPQEVSSSLAQATNYAKLTHSLLASQSFN